jgi:hypothetical protein
VATASGRAGLGKVIARLGTADIVERLADLPASELTTLLLEVASARASHIAPLDVHRRYRSDRFSRPAPTPFEALRKIEELFIGAVHADTTWVVASPLAPFGVHAALGQVTQDWVVSTVRPNEAAADPTVALALEAASVRANTTLRRGELVQQFATIQRVTRAQLYESPDTFAHFSIFGLVTAGRSWSSNTFDVESLLEHLTVYEHALSRVAESIEIVLSLPDDPGGARLRNAVAERWPDSGTVSVSLDPARLLSQRYYRRGCFKVHAIGGGRRFEVADGGFTDWTERLLDDRHERLLISGAGLDRPALFLRGTDGGEGDS